MCHMTDRKAISDLFYPRSHDPMIPDDVVAFLIGSEAATMETKGLSQHPITHAGADLSQKMSSCRNCNAKDTAQENPVVQLWVRSAGTV